MKTIVAFAAVLLIAGCTLEDGAGPAPTGPSEYALSVTVSAAPDRLPRDGSSQSLITATVRDDSSRPVSGQRLHVSSSAGMLSETDVVTNGSGQALVTFTAPDAGTVGNSATIAFVPIGTNAGNAVPRTVSIAFIGPSNTGAPRFAPIPFTVLPSPPEAGVTARFDASGSFDAAGNAATGVFDEGVPCMDACSYVWDFGDGSTGAGRVVNHTFSAGKTYIVTLAVTDLAGTSASTAYPVAVSSVAAPTVTITVSPTSPPAGQPATLAATARAATGHSIQTYAWSFGDGTTQTTTTPTVVKSYSAAGIYVVTVTVTDDLGQQGSNSLSITIGSGITFPSPAFTVSPSTPVTSQTVSFNASGVTTLGGATITQYDWDFGDGTSATGTAATVTKTNGYGTAGTYTVRLTVTDSAGRTGTATVAVSVSDP